MSYTSKRTLLLSIIYFGVQAIQDLPLVLCRLSVAATTNPYFDLFFQLLCHIICFLIL